MILLYSITLFLSSFLLFTVEPMIGKMVLPLLGGTPAVWNTCMVFFQGMLLLGYLYAHWISKSIKPRWQGIMQIAGFCVAFCFLPVRFSGIPPGEGLPFFWLFYTLAIAAGLPFLVLSALAPLLQGWFSRSGHSASGNPYFLYSASNIGSLVALLCYPVVIEPFFRLSTQGFLWKTGFGFLGCLLILCVFFGTRNGELITDTQDDQEESAAIPVPVITRLRWILLAFTPSCWLLAMTNYLTKDLTPFPLMWVLPLAIYMATYAIVFAPKPVFSHARMLQWQPFFLLPPLVLFMLPGKNSLWLELPIQFSAFFINAMVCHGELVQSRPHPSRLTEFYLWIAVGGVLGGLFVSLLAPVLFTFEMELPVAILLCICLRPITDLVPKLALKHIFALLVISVAVLFVTFKNGNIFLILNVFTIIGMLLFSLIGVILSGKGISPWKQGAAIAVFLLVFRFLFAPDVMFQERDFFGTVRVVHDQKRKIRMLMHGSTSHGVQSDLPELSKEPMAYYHPTGPFGMIYPAIPVEAGKRNAALIGLGTGSQAAYGEKGDQFTFFEIDPVIARVAKDDRYFTYLKDTKAQWRVVLGDARLSIQQSPANGYDLLVVDAFSSDAIPVHLLTREALRLYESKLKPEGLMAFHITNHFLDLRPVVGSLAADIGWRGYVMHDIRKATSDGRAISGSKWVVLAKDQRLLERFAADPRWVDLNKIPPVQVWTDDFSNILRVLQLFRQR